MGVPQEGPSLPCDGEVVYELMPGLYWALSDVCRPISPTCSELSDPMPIYIAAAAAAATAAGATTTN